jgi:AraC-like DNA-binding protein
MARIAIQNAEQWITLARQSAYSANRLSKSMGISRRQLQRYTHELFKRSPQDWLNDQRLTRAADLLKEHRCVKTVAYQLGFKQISHFSRVFKLRYGQCPSVFLSEIDRETNPLNHRAASETSVQHYGQDQLELF